MNRMSNYRCSSYQGLIFINLFMLIYILGVLLKKIYNFQDGFVDIALISVISFSIGIRVLFKLNILKKIFFNMWLSYVLILFTILYVFLGINSYNNADLIFLEYMSILKWLIYFYLGLLFGLLYQFNEFDFNQNKLFLLFILIVFIYSLTQYNFSGLSTDIGDLFNFYDNSFESIFSLRSVFSLFAVVILFYSFSSNDSKPNFYLLIISLIFIFMSGNRKALLAILLVLLFIEVQGKYRKVVNIGKLFIVVLVIGVFVQTSLFEKSIGEYGNLKQPRMFIYYKSFDIASDYFPFGPGPSTFASKGSIINYSPIYEEYGMSERWGFRENDEIYFINDTYWGQIIGQYGVVGTLLMLLMFFFVYKMIKSTEIESRSLLKKSSILVVLMFLSLTTPVFQRIEIAFFVFFNMGMGLSSSIYLDKTNGYRIEKINKIN